MKNLSILAAGLASRMRSCVLSRLAGEDPNRAGDKHVVYVHFDAKGVVANFVLFQIRSFVDCGFRVTFVSNSPHFVPAQHTGLKSLCREIIHRRNVGYDFAAYRDGISSIPALEHSSCLIIANDSVYGPLYPLAELLQRCDPNACDVWGATDSEEIAYHLQSYFVVFFPRALRSRAFRSFWTWYPNVGNRDWVIKNGELGLSRCLIQAGLRVGAVFKCADAERRREQKLRAVKTLPPGPEIDRFLSFVFRPDRSAATLNPTQVFWEEMLVEERYPFLKRDLIRENIQKVPTVTPWKTLVAQHTQYDPALIEKHLGSGV